MDIVIKIYVVSEMKIFSYVLKDVHNYDTTNFLATLLHNGCLFNFRHNSKNNVLNIALDDYGEVNKMKDYLKYFRG